MMQYVHFNADKYLVGRDGKPFYLTGINFTAGYVCSDFWADWRPESIRRDLEQIHSLGLNGVRIPLVWNTFEPEEGKPDPVILERFETFLGWCRELEIYVMPWCLVGVATEEYDLSWRNGRSYFFDESMIQAAENHLQMLGRRFREHEMILCWDICDEPEWYSRWSDKDVLPYPTDKFTHWVDRMAKAFHSADPNHLVTLGFGHIATANYGMDLRDCADKLDFMAVTAYPNTYGEPLSTPRPGYELLYHLDMNRRYRPSFLCESPGWSNTMAAEESIAHLYNTTLYSSWLHNSCGVMPWVFSFYSEDIVTRRGSTCLEIHPEEPWFGIVDEDRNVLQKGRVLEAFAHKTRELNAVSYKMPQARTALIVPRGYHRMDYGSIAGRMIAVHSALCAADIPVDMVWYDELDPEKYPFAILSMLSHEVTSTDWRMMAEYVEKGGTLLNFCIRGTIYFPRMFGVIQDGTEHTTVSSDLKITASFGDLQTGAKLSFSHSHSSNRARIQPAGGEICAVYADGAPAMIHHQYGKGQTFLVAANVLDNLLYCPNTEWKQSGIFALLRAAAKASGIITPSFCPDPGVETGVLEGAEDALLIVVNHNIDRTEAHITLYTDRRPVDTAVDCTDNTITLILESGEAAVIHLQ